MRTGDTPVDWAARSAAVAPGAVQLRATSLAKTYGGAGKAKALELFRGLDLEVAAGEMVAIVGRSGTGKSSLLHLLAGLDRPSAGEILIEGTALSGLSPDRLATLRNERVGYVWQFHYLLPEFSAAENVALPLLARGMPRHEAEQAAIGWLARVGLGGRAGHRSGELSGGEQQRVAVARALVTQPSVLLADEPTGDLDEETAAQLFALLQELCREHRLAVLMVTHNLEIAGRCDRVLRLVGGRLQQASEPLPGGLTGERVLEREA